MIQLTNRMWFSVVCTLIDNDTRQHSGQNVVDSRGAATISKITTEICQDFTDSDLKVHALHFMQMSSLYASDFPVFPVKMFFKTRST